MRNLRNIRFGRWSHHDITAVCWDSDTDDVLCTVGPTASNSSIELVRIKDGREISHRVVTSWDAPSPSPDEPVDKIVNLHHLSGTGTTCLVLAGGDIVTIQEQAGGQSEPHIEIVGSIDSGIAAARWSPDEELLVIVTKLGSLVLMGSSFDPVTEITLSSEDLKASKHVSVGWGKRETQFQGRGAKALRDPTIPEKVDEGVISPNDDGATTISWRGDGAFFSINAVEGSRRVVRVYSREGELDSASEPVDGLESALSWRPAGNLIAGIQRLADRVDVVFFERNGLRHGQFTLRSPAGPVTTHERIRLEWNSDSTVLAVILQDMIQMWTMGNYHWYLKQERQIDGCSVAISWHPEKSLRSAVQSATGLVLSEDIFHTSRGTCRPPYDNGAVAVIDGDTVKLTAFRSANIPPPMSQFEIVAESAVVDVAFGPRNDTIAIMHRQGVDQYQWPSNNGRQLKPQLARKVRFDIGEAILHVPLRISTDMIYNYACTVFEDNSLALLELAVGEKAPDTFQRIDASQTRGPASSSEETTSRYFSQDAAGQVYTVGNCGNVSPCARFPLFLPWFDVVTAEDDPIAFGLSRSGHLYANTRQLVKNCTSFVLTPRHLIFTTNNHFVKYVHLTSEVDELEVPDDDPEKDERCRSVERGARLVTAMPTTMSIVLQMPRGNLETIFPRAMVVAGIRGLIEEKNYARAFSYCRTQRVDMNILYDHRPEQFLANTGTFLDQLKDITSIDLFLSSLREEDVTQTMYQDTRKLQHPVAGQPPAEIKPSLGSTSKVNAICDALLKSLASRKATNLQNIITAHVCKNPPALDDGLTLVAELMREDEKVAEGAVEHICFLVDVNRLYENALGLYMLDLALLVAQQSQRDPREYLPFIQELHELAELRRKFKIDDHLGRRAKALVHLQALDAFDELCSYTEKHTLYQESLKLYRYDHARHRALTDLYAAYLQSTSAFREAGLAYESLQEYTKATSCYRAAGASCWQECLFTALQQAPPPAPEVVAELASALADALWEAKDYSAAATIHLDYLSSLETAVKCLCKGYHFAEAIRLVTQQSRPDLLSTAVDSGLGEALGSTTEFLADCKGQVLAQVPRIAELRRRAAEDPLAFYEGERPGGGGDIPDDVSIAASSRLSTSASLFTRYTGKTGATGTTGNTGTSRATSKNRRREEKKRARGRKGTVYEEEYLVNSVCRLVERVEATKPEVERLVFALARRGMAERARAAEALMADVVAACQGAVAEVFPAETAASKTLADDGGAEQGGDGGANWKATGADAVLQEWEQARLRKTEPPVVTAMKKLALLGT